MRETRNPNDFYDQFIDWEQRKKEEKNPWLYEPWEEEEENE